MTPDQSTIIVILHTYYTHYYLRVGHLWSTLSTPPCHPPRARALSPLSDVVQLLFMMYVCVCICVQMMISKAVGSKAALQERVEATPEILSRSMDVRKSFEVKQGGG